jgi:hypothetical protein
MKPNAYISRERMRTWCAWVLFLLLLGVCGVSQAQERGTPESERPSLQNAQQDQDRQEEKKDEGQQEEKQPVIPKYQVEVGYANWDLSGNENKFRQYATPPHGIFLKGFQYNPVSLLHGFRGDYNLIGLGSDDYFADSRMLMFFGDISFKGSLRRNRFLDDVITPVGLSDRQEGKAQFKFKLAPEFAISSIYSLSEQNHFFQSPREALRQRTRYWDMVAEGKVGETRLSLGFSDFRFFDRTLALPDTAIKRWRLSGVWEPFKTLGLEASYLSQEINQSAVSNHIDTISLASNWAVGPDTDIQMNYRHDSLNLPTVQTSFIREQHHLNARLVHRWPQWLLQAGINYRETERIRGDRLFLNIPKLWGFEGRLAGRLSRNLRLTLRGSTQHLSSLPLMLTADTRSLYWNDRRFIQLKLDGGSPSLNGYFLWTHRRLANDIRASDVTSHFLTAGGNWEVNSRLSAFAEYNYEFWSGKSADSTVFPFQENYIPNSRVTVLGVSWALTDQVFLLASYTDFTTDNDNPLREKDGNYAGRFLTMNLRYRFPAGHELRLTVAPWLYRDRIVDSMSYTATVLMLSGSAKF